MEKYLGYSRYLRECLNIKKDDLNHSGNQTNHLRHESSHPVFSSKILFLISESEVQGTEVPLTIWLMN